MKILVISDTHGRQDNLVKVLKKIRNFDLLIHAGDVEGREEEIENLSPAPCVFVRGNNDYEPGLRNEEIVYVEHSHHIYVTHGHRQAVYFNTKKIKEVAKKRRCDIAIYGHTHRPVIDTSDPDVTVLNPGSLTYPRQENRLPSFLVIDIDHSGKLHYTINYVKRDGSLVPGQY